MMEIAAAIGTATSVLKMVKALKDLDHALDKSELKANMAELYSDLADVKMALVDAQQEIHAKSGEIEELKNQNAFIADLVTVEGFKYDQIDGRPTGLPYCPTCEVSEGKLYRLGKRNDTYSLCKNCKNQHVAAADGRVNERENRPAIKVPRTRRT